jgi:hypothetical protein
VSASGVQFEPHSFFSDRACASRVCNANVPALGVNDHAVESRRRQAHRDHRRKYSGHKVDTKSVAARNALIVVGADGLEPPTFAL